jgi:glycosyltransferase involved in cell wall biosynthesis
VTLPDLDTMASPCTDSRGDVRMSVVMCTYNRCDILVGAIESVLDQSADAPAYELIVVDNNSSDDTRSVVQRFIDNGASRLRYIFEGRQGLSHARNAGIAAANGEILAFTDDDIRASPDWIAGIARAFDEHPEIDLIGGKVLPRWNNTPPPWLTPDHYTPLALLDYGETSFETNLHNQRCMVGANLSVRRGVFEAVGMFQSDFQRVKDSIGSCEDHEFQLRFWRRGKRGLYVPGIEVSADVQNNRLEKEYHRRWYRGHGGFMAMLWPAAEDALTFMGVPLYDYAQLVRAALGWPWAKLNQPEHLALAHEFRLREAASVVAFKYDAFRRAGKASFLGECARLVRSGLQKKLGPGLRRSTPQ